MTEKFRAAAAALHVIHNKEANLEKIQAVIGHAAEDGVRLLVLPEVVLQGPIFFRDHCFDPEESQYLWDRAETVPGPSAELIAERAAEHHMYVIFGMWERVDYPAAPVLRNSALLTGPEGIIGKYHKVHQPSEEVNRYLPGRDWPVFDTPLGTIGMMICYDQCFPEAARELTLRGAEVLAVPNAWSESSQGPDDRYDFFGRARAAENNRWLIQSNLVGPSDKGNFNYTGGSRIIDPTGRVVAETPDGEEGLAIAEIAPTKFDPTQARSGWHLRQRVPSTYTSIADTPHEK